MVVTRATLPVAYRGYAGLDDVSMTPTVHSAIRGLDDEAA